MSYEKTIEVRRRSRDIERAVRDTLQAQVDSDLARGGQPSANLQNRLQESESRLLDAEASLLAAEEQLDFFRITPPGTEPVRQRP